MKVKLRMMLFVMIIWIACALSGCSSIKYRHNEGCWWDQNSPTMKLTNNDGEDVYICERCASTCMYCSEKTDEFGFNLLGGPIPVCKYHNEY